MKNIIYKKIIEKLNNAFNPFSLKIINESHMHNVPEDSESHFKIVIVSDTFIKESMVNRHKSIYKSLVPSDFSIAQMVGHQRGLAVLVGNTLEHFHFSQSTSINNVPAVERVKTVLVGSDIVALAGHPRLAVVAFATSSSEIQVVDFRNPNASLRIQVDVEIDTIVWVSPSLISHRPACRSGPRRRTGHRPGSGSRSPLTEHGSDASGR